MKRQMVVSRTQVSPHEYCREPVDEASNIAEEARPHTTQQGTEQDKGHALVSPSPGQEECLKMRWSERALHRVQVITRRM